MLYRADFQLSCSSSQIIAFDKGCLSLMHLFFVTSANIALGRMLLKLDSLDCIFSQTAVYEYIFKNHFDVIDQKATKFGRIIKNNDHYVIEGHSLSLFLVPVKSPHATSY